MQKMEVIGNSELDIISGGLTIGGLTIGGLISGLDTAVIGVVSGVGGVVKGVLTDAEAINQRINDALDGAIGNLNP